MDTTATAQERYVELLRRRPAYERLAIAASLSRAVRELAAAGIRAQRPSIGEQELHVRLAVRVYGRAVAERLFSTVPDDAR